MLDSPIDEIKNRLDIVEVIGSYIKLHKAGANFRAVCPFHSEKKPSFFVSPARQIWHCFGCGSGHSIFDFVMKIEGVEFGDALRILAQRAGVELKKQTPESVKWRSERERLYEICEWATRFFEKQLEESKVGKEAKKYLLNRRITEESIKKWRLGYSPDVWQGLSDFLVGKGYQREEIAKAGLAIESSNLEPQTSNIYDRFRGRIIFPIFDLNSQIIGFGGRVFKEKDKEEVAKYVNTPNTLLYDKSRVLYGLDRAKLEIRKKDACILVEGYTDAILSHQAGIQNVVATSGTALTPYQLKILKRYSENLILGFDMDIAGDAATKRGIDLAQLQGFNIKIITLPGDSDPADIISENPKKWEELIEKAKSILDFYFETTLVKFNLKKPEGKKEISKILLPVIKRIPNQIEKAFWTQKLSRELEVREEDIREELRKVNLEENLYGLEPEEIINLPPKPRKQLLEERMITLVLLLKSSESLEFITQTELVNLSPKMQEIFKYLKENPPAGGKEGRELDLKGLSPEDVDLFNYCYLKAGIEEVEKKDIMPEIKNCLKEIKCLEIKNKLDELSKEIKKAEEEKNEKKIQELLREFNSFSKSLLIIK